MLAAAGGWALICSAVHDTAARSDVMLTTVITRDRQHHYMRYRTGKRYYFVQPAAKPNSNYRSECQKSCQRMKPVSGSPTYSISY